MDSHSREVLGNHRRQSQDAHRDGVELESAIRGSPSFTPSAPLRNTGRASISERVALLGGTMRVSDPKVLAVGSYFAVLSANDRELNDGRWGSSAQLQEPGNPGRWEASR
jgi:hypothetical protein